MKPVRSTMLYHTQPFPYICEIRTNKPPRQFCITLHCHTTWSPDEFKTKALFRRIDVRSSTAENKSKLTKHEPKIWSARFNLSWTLNIPGIEIPLNDVTNITDGASLCNTRQIHVNTPEQYFKPESLPRERWRAQISHVTARNFESAVRDHVSMKRRFIFSLNELPFWTF